MFSSKSFLCLLLVAFSAVDASPLSHRDSGLPSLRFATRFNELSMRDIVENDRARVRAFHQAGSLAKRDTLSVDVTSQGVSYVAQVGVGSPPTTYQLSVNTQTGNTIVGANKAYVQTETSFYTGDALSVSFGFGSDFVKLTGLEWEDTVTLSSQIVIENQSIGVTSPFSFGGLDGVLGLGSTASTIGTVENTGAVPTVPDNIYSQILNNNGGSLNSRAPNSQTGFGAQPESSGGSYGTESSQSNGGGTLTFGGYDSSFVVGTPFFVPLTTTAPASNNWGINSSVTYGGETIMPNTAGILDIGTTLILLPTDAYESYQEATGSTVDKTNGLLYITPDQYYDLSNLIFEIEGVPFTLIPDAQVWSSSMNAALGGSSDKIYLVIGDSGQKSGSGLGFILGHAFFLRYYTIYDSTPGNKQVGLGYTDYTLEVLNAPIPSN